MPIYAYKCDSCGFAKDVLQKISDTPLHQCPTCGKDSFKKQLTAAGFQLKGSGWYATDFKGGNASAPAAADAAKADSTPAPSESTPAVAAAPSTSATPPAAAAT
jgi:putative FmdB family regulatory protein